MRRRIQVQVGQRYFQDFVHGSHHQIWEVESIHSEGEWVPHARLVKAGKREYVQVLRLLETFALEEVHGAIRDALRLGAIGYDAVKHLVLCRVERRPPRLDLNVYPYLPRAQVTTTSAASYMSLLGGAAP